MITHLTRMRDETICVAGIDPESGEHLRPLLAAEDDRMTRALLSERGGPFEFGTLVELGETEPCPKAPHIEDHVFDPAAARNLGRIEPASLTALLDAVAVRSARNAFGTALQRRGEKYATDPGEGERSLAVIRLRGPAALELDPRNHLFLRFESAAQPTLARLTDLRFYGADGHSLNHDLIDAVSARLRAGSEAFAMLGLGRAWQGSGDDAKRHWLQANGVCFAEDPFGP